MPHDGAICFPDLPHSRHPHDFSKEKSFAVSRILDLTGEGVRQEVLVGHLPQSNRDLPPPATRHRRAGLQRGGSGQPPIGPSRLTHSNRTESPSRAAENSVSTICFKDLRRESSFSLDSAYGTSLIMISLISATTPLMTLNCASVRS